MPSGRVVRGTSLDAATANVSAPAANTAATITVTAVAAKKHKLVKIGYSYNATPTGGNIKVEAPAGTVMWTMDVGALGEKLIDFAYPLAMPVNTNMVVTLAAAGATVTGKLNIQYLSE
jgi:hypothetical protein